MKFKFYEGDTVFISPKSYSYNGKFSNRCGVVRRTYCGKRQELLYGVAIKNEANPASAMGLYWFSEKELNKNSKIESEEIIMFKNFTKVDVHFCDEKNPDKVVTYAYYPEDFDGKEIHEGDYVVCHTLHHGFSVAVVARVFKTSGIFKSSNATDRRVEKGREIVGFVNVEAFEKRREAEEKAKLLKSRMDEKISQIQQEEIYKMFAEKNPELQAMLDEYKSIVEG